MSDSHYDIAIAGGGLAGLTAAILLRRKGYSVAVFEKDAYPHHKVCGEYISGESRVFLSALGIPVDEMGLPGISTLHLTSPSGRSFTAPLPPGGFGISRFLLDATLAGIAAREGASVFTPAQVLDISFDGKDFLLEIKSERKKSIQISSRLCLGSFGKRSSLDWKWKRPFLEDRHRGLDNFIGIKYHIRTSWPEHIIGLHNFSNGYCGISRVEDGRYCLCYITRAKMLRRCGNSMERLQSEVLSVNPHLRRIFSDSEFLDGFPVAISQISFRRKTLVEDHVLMLGDAAGMITPLCGNGMSIAMQTASIASRLVSQYLDGELTLQQLGQLYSGAWKKHFSTRIQTGRILQRFFGSNYLSNAFVGAFSAIPMMARPVIRLTHGKEF